MPEAGCCFCQYCITMAMLAAPQPSFSCFTNGTSSQTPAPCVAKAMPQRHNNIEHLCGKPRTIRPRLANSNDDQNQRNDGQDNQDQVALLDPSCGKISLSFAGSCCQLGQLLIAQSGDGSLDLLRIHFGGLQRFLRSWGRKKLLDGFQIAVPHLRRRHGFFLQVRRTHYVALGHKIGGNHKERSQDNSNYAAHTLTQKCLHVYAPQMDSPASKKSIHQSCLTSDG